MFSLKELNKTKILLIILAFVILLNIILSYFISLTPKTNKISCSTSKKSIERVTENMSNMIYVKGYFASWCHNCTNMKSEWEKFMKDSNSNKTAIVTEIYCDKDNNEKKCQAENIRGFPTIMFTKDDTTKEYMGKRTAKALHEFVKNM